MTIKNTEELTTRTQRHLAAINQLANSPDVLLKHQLIGGDARFSTPRAAKAAGVPVSSAYREPVLSRLRALADVPVPVPEGIDVTPSSAANGGREGSLRPNVDASVTEKWLASATARGAKLEAAHVELALDTLEAWDGLLDSPNGRVPSYGLRPAKGVIARMLFLHPLVLEHPDVDAMLLALARRHGVASARGGTCDASDRFGPALGAVTDRMHSLALRGAAFPADASGLPLLGPLVADLGLDPEVVYRHRFRLHAAECQRQLLGPEAVPSGNALSLALAHAIVDIYDREVSAETKAPPLSIQGIIRLEPIERKLNLVAGTCQRHPEIGERLRAIAERYIRSLKEERGAERKADRLAFIVARIEALGEEMAGREKAAVNSSGGVSMQALSVALGLQFRENATHPLVEAAIAAFVAKVGLKEKRNPPRPPRSKLDDEVDAYCRLIRSRGFGPPRPRACATGTTSEGAAAELGIVPEELTSNQKDRIRKATQSVHGLNPVVVDSEPFAHEINSPDRTDLLSTLLADPIFDDGLPGDPLDSRKLDWNALSTALGVGTLYLRQSRSARTLIDAKLLTVGIAPHPGDRSGITFGELRTFGRRRRAEQALAASSSCAQNQAGATPANAALSLSDAIEVAVQPASVAARSVRALESYLKTSGLALSDTVGLTLLNTTPGMAIDAVELRRWRLFHAELAAARACHPFELPFGAANWGWRKMPLGSALTLLCRAAGATGAKLARESGAGHLAESWMRGLSIPRWPDEQSLESLNSYFDLAPGTLAGLLNADRRALGSVPGERGRRTAIACHLPFRYASMEEGERREALKRAQGCAVQDTIFSKRHRIIIHDAYILRKKHWPKGLQAEWELFEKRRHSKAEQPNRKLDIFDTIEEQFAVAGSPVASPTSKRELDTFERFFGFLILAIDREDRILLPTRARADEMEFHKENMRLVNYRPRGGLEIPISQLTMGAAALPGLVRAFIAFSAHRSDGYSRGTISEVKNILQAVAVGSPLKVCESVQTKTSQLLVWLKENRPDGCLGYERETAGWKELTWENAAFIYTAIYLNLFKYRTESKGPRRDKVPKELRVEPKRVSFDPVMVVLTSETPAAVYRLVLQEMIRNQPADALGRHTHLRDCLLALILFQTFLRIKNIAQLTYADDQTGQLRRIGKSWFIRIHRSRFKNGGGAYFRHGHYFLMRLRDEDGLYSMIDAYLKVSRPYLRSLKAKPSNAGPATADCTVASATIKEDVGSPAISLSEAYDDADELNLTAADDEDGDNFEDADGDGMPDEARFFVKPGGGQYLPSQMAVRYKHLTNRYMCASPDRRRGLKGLMPHGPHAVRHVGATDALAREGSWEAAARVIQDSIRAVEESYVLFTPDRQGKLAGASMERGRSAKPRLPDGIFLLSKPGRS